MGLPNIDQDDEGNKVQIVYNAIKELIIKDELKPGTLLVERRLAEYLDLSRTPVREALRKLEASGFVEFIPNSGVFVSHIKIEDIIEIYELREGLDAIAVRLCTQRINDDIIQELESNVLNSEQEFIGNDYLKYLEYDMAFHEVYIREAKNQRLKDILYMLLDQIKRIANLTIGDAERVTTSIQQHKGIIEAMKQQDTARAEQLARDHMTSVKEYHINRLYKK
jgi:DNA-binding GntR family transcriptional regulator